MMSNGKAELISKTYATKVKIMEEVEKVDAFDSHSINTYLKVDSQSKCLWLNKSKGQTQVPTVFRKYEHW